MSRLLQLISQCNRKLGITPRRMIDRTVIAVESFLNTLTGLGLIGLSGYNPDFPVATNFICGTVSCLTDTNRSGCTIGSNKRKRAIP